MGSSVVENTGTESTGSRVEPANEPGAKRTKTAAGSATTTTTTTTEAPKNTAVFVTGLPEDTTKDELFDYFAKYGVIMEDAWRGGPRIKLYYNRDTDEFKGEALVVYLRQESAHMAVDLLDQSRFRPQVIIGVQMAHHHHIPSNDQDPQDRGANGCESESQPSFPKLDKKTWRRHMQRMKSRLDWTEDDSVDPEAEKLRMAEARRLEKYRRIVILRNMFVRAQYDADVCFALDLKEEILEEAEKFGQVTAVHVLPAQQVCSIKFKDREAAAAAVRRMDGRMFDGRRISASLYDGSFSLREPTREAEGEDSEERLDKFGNWLETANDHNGG